MSSALSFFDELVVLGHDLVDGFTLASEIVSDENGTVVDFETVDDESGVDVVDGASEDADDDAFDEELSTRKL